MKQRTLFKALSRFSLIAIFLALFSVSCKKENIDDVSNQPPQLVAAIKILKTNATTTEFNDVDWSTATFNKLGNNLSLLKVKSKSNPEKTLLMTKKGGIIKIRWAQMRQNSPSLIVSSLNENVRLESIFRNGKITTINQADSKGNTTQIALNNIAGLSSPIKTQVKSANPNQPIARSFDGEDGFDDGDDDNDWNTGGLDSGDPGVGTTSSSIAPDGGGGGDDGGSGGIGSDNNGYNGDARPFLAPI